MTAGTAPEDEVVSAVGLPRRRGPVRPVPWALRRASADGPKQRWFPLGTLDSSTIARVDPAGLVQLDGATWSLDWWIGAEDRWHHPSMDTGISQAPIEGSAVIETRLRVPGGAILHRCGGARFSSRGASGDAVVVEVHNDSAVPVALALVVRPFTLEEPGSVSEVEIHHAQAMPVVTVDGAANVVFDREPRRVAHGDENQVAERLANGHDEPFAGQDRDDSVSWRGSGSLEVAFVEPLAHGATVKVVLPALPPQEDRRRHRWRRSKNVAAPGSLGTLTVGGLESVVSGWEVHSSGDPTLDWVVESASRFVTWSATMLRVAGPDAVTDILGRTHSRPSPSPSPSPPAPAHTAGEDLGFICRSLSSLPASELHDAVVGALVGYQRFSGCVELADHSDATSSLLDVASSVLVRPGVVGGPGAAVIERSEELLGPIAMALQWCDQHPERAGRLSPATLARLAAGLGALGQGDLARFALEQIPAAAGRLGTAGDSDGDPDVTAWLKDLSSAVESVMPGAGTARLVDQPEVHGFDLARIAAVRERLFDSAVADTPAGPTIAPIWSPAWNGRSLDMRRVPTAWGLVSASLRWHGEHAALLWEIEPWLPDSGGAAPAVSAGALSPGWSSSGWNGEALVEIPAASQPSART